jgi:pimeloyl-ACP methyl ester carboxylesterase
MAELPVDPVLLAEAEAALERLLPRCGVPVARRRATMAGVPVHWLEAGAGAPVVLLHGGFGGAGTWHRTLGPLARRYRVLAVDRPGYGLSFGPPAADPVAWLDAFLAAAAAPRVALVGHAAGGAVALAYAQARPRRVRALALSDLPLGEPGADPPVAAAPSRRPRARATFEASLGARFHDRRLLAPEYIDYLWALARLRPEQDQRPPGDLAPGPVPVPQPGERTWPTMPCLLVCGRSAAWSSVPLARLLHQRVPDAWLRVIKHSQGVPMLEQPGEFNFALITFLAARAEGA